MRYRNLLRTAFLAALYLIATMSVQAQCAFENIFPVKHGFTKFNVRTTLASRTDMREDKGAGFNYWEKHKYLRGDSVLESSLWYDLSKSKCFDGNSNRMYLRFVDDKLYKIQISLEFNATDFNACMENYKVLIAVMKSKFPDSIQYTSTDELRHEQIGKGYTFYPAVKAKRNKIKIEELSIGYKMEYAWKRDTNNVSYQSYEVDKYVIEIEYVNLKGTKLTNERY